MSKKQRRSSRIRMESRQPRLKSALGMQTRSARAERRGLFERLLSVIGL